MDTSEKENRNELGQDDASGQPADGGAPPQPPVDSGNGGEDDGRMEQRLDKLEADVAAIKLDIGVMKAIGATKPDMADLRAATKMDIAELRSATKADFAELRSATKADIAELRAETKAAIAELKTAMAESTTRIIIWVVGAVFLAQLLPALVALFQ